MNQVIKLRVLLDYDEDVFRDLEVACASTFADLHDLIQDAFGFDKSQMASFYESNDDWEKGQEITLMDVGGKSETGEPILIMADTKLSDVIFASGQKLLYVFDFMLMWCFYVDVIDMSVLDGTVIVPRIKNSFGTAPDQYSKSPEISFDFDIDDSSDDFEEDEFEDMFKMLSLDGDVGDEER